MEAGHHPSTMEENHSNSNCSDALINRAFLKDIVTFLNKGFSYTYAVASVDILSLQNYFETGQHSFREQYDCFWNDNLMWKPQYEGGPGGCNNFIIHKIESKVGLECYNILVEITAICLMVQTLKIRDHEPCGCKFSDTDKDNPTTVSIWRRGRVIYIPRVLNRCIYDLEDMVKALEKVEREKQQYFAPIESASLKSLRGAKVMLNSLMENDWKIKDCSHGPIKTILKKQIQDLIAGDSQLPDGELRCHDVDVGQPIRDLETIVHSFKREFIMQILENKSAKQRAEEHDPFVAKDKIIIKSRAKTSELRKRVDAKRLDAEKGVQELREHFQSKLLQAEKINLRLEEHLEVEGFHAEEIRLELEETKAELALVKSKHLDPTKTCLELVNEKEEIADFKARTDESKLASELQKAQVEIANLKAKVENLQTVSQYGDLLDPYLADSTLLD